MKNKIQEEILREFVEKLETQASKFQYVYYICDFCFLYFEY